MLLLLLRTGARAHRVHAALAWRALPPLTCPSAARTARPRAGGAGAPELQETLQNFTINSVALTVLGFFVYRDVDGGAARPSGG